MLRGGILPPINKLTEIKIKNIRPSGKIERYADGGGAGKGWNIRSYLRDKFYIRCRPLWSLSGTTQRWRVDDATKENPGGTGGCCRGKQKQ